MMVLTCLQRSASAILGATVAANYADLIAYQQAKTELDALRCVAWPAYQTMGEAVNNNPEGIRYIVDIV